MAKTTATRRGTEYVKFELRKGDTRWFFTMTGPDTVQLECRFESLRTRLFTTDLADARARWAELVAVGFAGAVRK